jgi:GH18 family chitinase
LNPYPSFESSNNCYRQHYLVPEPALVSDITHVVLAFMQSARFNQAPSTTWPLFTTVDAVRSQFATDTVVMVAIGGWGDTDGFSKAAATESGRKIFAANVKAMVEHTGADGTVTRRTICSFSSLIFVRN